MTKEELLEVFEDLLDMASKNLPYLSKEKEAYEEVIKLIKAVKG